MSRGINKQCTWENSCLVVWCAQGSLWLYDGCCNWDICVYFRAGKTWAAPRYACTPGGTGTAAR